MARQKRMYTQERIETTPEYELGERIRILAGHRAWDQCYAAIDEVRYAEEKHPFPERPLSCLDEIDLDTLAKLDVVQIYTIGDVLDRRSADVEWWRHVWGITPTSVKILMMAIESEARFDL